MKTDATLPELIESQDSRKSARSNSARSNSTGSNSTGFGSPGSERSGSAGEQAELLERILVEVAAPVVRRTIRYRLHFYISDRGTSPANPDAEDLYHDILTRLVVILRRLAGGERSAAITDFGQYAQRVAINCCNDYLRMKYPQRTRLRDRLRDLLERRSEFAIWRGEDGEPLCGLAEWRESGLARADAQRLAIAEAAADLGAGRSGIGVRGAALAGLLGDIFRLLEGPVSLEMLVAVVVVQLGITEYRCESLDSESDSADGFGTRSLVTRLTGDSLSPSGRGGQERTVEGWIGVDRREDGAVGLERHIDERIALRRMWEIWLTLPPRPRETFFYCFSTSRGEDLLTLLFEAGVATPGEVAGVLGLTLEELIENWRRMPMRNVELAAMWGVPRQQVNKWRFQALRMIEKRLI